MPFNNLGSSQRINDNNHLGNLTDGTTIYTLSQASRRMQKESKTKKHTTPGIRWSSPTQLLVWPSLAYLGQSGRDAEFSSGYGRM
ncbi:hypothetical protein B0T17DRAFT_219707 [Bombardia bombarda]|uniref:Uncharacterized protein n=1 Tax=Bombardia bombarda TaxID=252184 RepID=A0AA39XB20_9PEZI|nr:hypothetical protein B0T17DRAFT_219707 [Bombardia bombarda]